MANFHFFTDADATGVLNSQDAGSAFGAVSDTEFRVTSLHTAATTPRAFAICEGKVAIQQDAQSHLLTLILKPTDQPGVGNKINFVPIKYFIYKGVVKASLLAGLSVADASKNHITFRAHQTQEKMNRAAEALLDEPANSVNLTPSSDLLGYNIEGDDAESLDKLFYKPDNSQFEPLTVYAGDYIGDFDMTLFGLEIVLDEVRADANFKLTREVATKLVADVPAANNDSQLFKCRRQKEAAISFMDPCAFFGSFFQRGGLFNRPLKLRYRLSTDIINVEEATNDSDLHKAKGVEIYENLLVHFFNKNAVYLDIRNELNTSLNFYQHYDNHIKLNIPQADDEIIVKDYYGNYGWPLLALRPADYDLHGQNNDSGKDEIKAEIALPNPSDENVSPLVYISQGYTRRMKRNKVPRGEKRYVPLATVEGYTQSFAVVIANVPGEPKITPVSQYIRIKYLKSVPGGASSGIVPRASNYLDLLFLPFGMKIPFAVSANSKSKVYQEDAFLGLAAASGCESAGAVGIAADTKNYTFFAYAGDKLKTKGTTRLGTIALASEVATESHYLNLVRDRYKREQLVKGNIFVGTAPYPSYLRFVDGTPAAVRDLFDANLRDEFVAVLISKEKFVEMSLDSDFSPAYDVFMRFTNESQDVDVAGVEYTSFDLMLEGYKDDGSSVALETFDPQVKLYSIGHGHNLILLDEHAEYDASTPADLPFQCTGAFSQEELEHLYNFLDQLQTSAPAPFSDLYAKVFFINQDIRNKIEVKDDGPAGSKYRLVNPFTDPPADPNQQPTAELPKGFLAEACTIFTLYKLDMQLALDTGADKQNVDVDGPGKTAIYKALKKVLIEAGFLKPALGGETLEFNEMMSPNRHIGVRGEYFLTEPEPVPINIKRKFHKLIKVGNLAGQENAGARRFITTKSLPLSEADVRNIIDDSLKRFGDTIRQFVDDESSCAYKILSGERVAPRNLFLATGDGTQTSGLLETAQNNTGVLLFDYEYDGQAGVKDTALRPFPSVETNFSTAVHLTMFGLDSGIDSTVEVMRDGISFVFKANTNNKIIRPIDGSPALHQARYSAADKLFYQETTSGILPLTRYDPDKRELIFLGKEKNFSFQVRLTSAHAPNAPAEVGYEEVSVSINVVEGPEIKEFVFEAEKLFASDVFVLTPTQKDNLLAAPRYNEPLEFMIDRLINVFGIPVRIDLHGNFIGKALPPGAFTNGSKLERDGTYQFHQTQLEGRAPEVSGEDPVRFPPLKYSFGRVIITSSNIIITIDSFVSPQWSRLDNKVPAGQQARLDSLTHYHASAGSDAYIEPPADFQPTNVNLPKMPSYNPILSGLRSFGLAEALVEIVVARAKALKLDKGYTDDQIDDMELYLRAKLAQAEVAEEKRLGIGAKILFSDYDSFKP